jgi:signal transduction histidine kinase
MADSVSTREPGSRRFDLNPAHSLAAGAMWLIIALAVTFSTAAAVWVGRIARKDVIEQHVRRLSLETDQLSSDLGQALASRLGAVRAARFKLGDIAAANQRRSLSDVFDELLSVYPELDWVAVADSNGVIVRSARALPAGTSVASRDWFTAGLRGPWLGVIEAPGQPDDALQGDLAAPLQDKSGRVIGVIAAHLRQPREVIHPLRLTDESNPAGSTQAYVIDRAGVVLIGVDGTRGKPWNGVALSGGTPALQFERLPDGRQVLVSRAPLRAAGGVPALDWRVLLCEPIGRVYQRADALAQRILWVALCLGAATAVLGTIGALQLTRRLKRLTLSVAAVGRGGGTAIDVPPGKDEVARLGRAFANILDDLQRERAELETLSGELERRVAFRTREVERLAQESRHAAIVRERLKIARDLHDTLAHSMMAMLSEIRFLRKLQSYDPAALPEELAHAEEVAHEGLKEARNAIIQMRASTVHEMGLGPGLAAAFDHFIDRTGLAGDFTTEPEAASFGDDRAETLLRMAHEALRNIERHARATRATVRLRMTDPSHLELSIEDNGIGFDPSASSSGHYGIVGLREQAELIGAALRIDSRRNAGTRVTVSLPLSPIPFAPRT